MHTCEWYLRGPRRDASRASSKRIRARQVHLRCRTRAFARASGHKDAPPVHSPLTSARGPGRLPSTGVIGGSLPPRLGAPRRWCSGPSSIWAKTNAAAVFRIPAECELLVEGLPRCARAEKDQMKDCASAFPSRGHPAKGWRALKRCSSSSPAPQEERVAPARDSVDLRPPCPSTRGTRSSAHRAPTCDRTLRRSRPPLGPRWHHTARTCVRLSAAPAS